MIRALLVAVGFVTGVAWATGCLRAGAEAYPVPVLIDQYADFNGVARWRAHRVARCESGYLNIANFAGSGAKGVFQFLDGTWRAASWQAGWGGYSVWDVEANVAVALWLMGRGQWAHWRACL